MERGPGGTFDDSVRVSGRSAGIPRPMSDVAGKRCPSTGWHQSTGWAFGRQRCWAGKEGWVPGVFSCCTGVNPTLYFILDSSVCNASLKYGISPFTSTASFPTFKSIELNVVLRSPGVALREQVAQRLTIFKARNCHSHKQPVDSYNSQQRAHCHLQCL